MSGKKGKRSSTEKEEKKEKPAKKVKRSGKDEKESQETKEKKDDTKIEELLLPSVSASHFRPVPSRTVTLVTSAAEPDLRGTPLEIQAEAKVGESVPWEDCDAIVPEMQFEVAKLSAFMNQSHVKEAIELATAMVCETKDTEDEDEKMESRDERFDKLREMQLQLLDYGLVKGYTRLETDYKWYCTNTLLGENVPDENCIFTQDGGNGIDHVLIDAKDNASGKVVLDAEKAALVEIAIETWAIINGRVLERVDGDFGKPKHLWIFFASDFPLAAFCPELDDELSLRKVAEGYPLNVFIQAVVKTALGKKAESWTKNLNAIWLKDFWKGLRSQRFHFIPADILDIYTKPHRPVQKEVFFRSVNGVEVSANTMYIPFGTDQTRRNPAAYFAMPLTFVSSWASPWIPAFPPPPMRLSCGSRVEWLFDVVKRFTNLNSTIAKAQKLALKDGQAESNASKESIQTEETWNHARDFGCRLPYVFHKARTCWSFRPLLEESTTREFFPHSPFALSSSSIFSLAELQSRAPFLKDRKLQPWLKALRIVKKLPEPFDLKQSILITPDLVGDFSTAEQIPLEYFTQVQDLEKYKSRLSWTMCGAPPVSVLEYARSVTYVRWTPEDCFMSFLTYLKCCALFCEQRDAIRMACELTILRQNVGHETAMMELLQVGERLLFAIIRQETRPSKLMVALQKNDAKRPNIMYARDKGEPCIYADKVVQSRSKGVLHLLHKVRSLAHAFMTEQKRNYNTGREVWAHNLMSLEQGVQEPGTKLLLHALTQITAPQDVFTPSIAKLTESSEVLITEVPLGVKETIIRNRIIQWLEIRTQTLKETMLFDFDSVLRQCAEALLMDFSVAQDLEFNPYKSLARILHSIENPHKKCPQIVRSYVKTLGSTATNVTTDLVFCELLKLRSKSV